jgi:hypothetical protein
MEIEKNHMGDEPGGEPESRFYYPFESWRHISIKPHVISAASILVFSNQSS